MNFAHPQLKAKKHPLVQTKLTIGQPGDKYEQEADAMADQVMRMPQADAPIQRKCEDCEEESLQMKPLADSITPIIQKQSIEEEEGALQMKSEGGGMTASSGLSSQLSQSKGGGSGLSASTNQQMSAAFGTDFGGVRVHTDNNAVQMNRSLNARAFTHGKDVYFNEGEYRPGGGEGKRLLAHELTHVVQQGGANNTLNRKAFFKSESYIAKAPDMWEAERGGNLWYYTKGEALERKKRLIKKGACTEKSCRVSEFPHPENKGKTAFRVLIYKKRKNNETKPNEKEKIKHVKNSKTPSKFKRPKPNNNSCPKGKAKKVTRDNCSPSGPINKENFIVSLIVDLSARKITATWSGGGVDIWECTPHPSHTPKGEDKVGVKCGIKHTNYSKDGMAFFTGFENEGYRIGFHNSQPVGKGFVSHGCVRVRCGVAEVINQNSWSSKTIIKVK